MKVFYENKTLETALLNIKNKASVGFIPTMGALHNGHLSLIKSARVENEIIVVSIFINPTQFDKEEDLSNYPRTLDKDLDLLKSVSCDYVFLPSANEIYDGNITASHFDFDGLEFEMEGKYRKGHFNGVATIVKRLFEIVKPAKAYFGKKDFQQLQIIKKLVEKYKIPVQIIGCNIFREDDGLAMSSRNSRLSKIQRREAPLIYKTLKKAKQKFKDHSIPCILKWVEDEFKNNEILRLEYFEIANIKNMKPSKRKSKHSNFRGFIAVFAGNIRLIDNIALN